MDVRTELRNRIANAIPATLTATPHVQIADAVMELFTEVAEYWQRVDETTDADYPGERWTETRMITAAAPVQVETFNRPVRRQP